MYDVGEETDSAYFTMNLKYGILLLISPFRPLLDLSGEWNWNVRSLYAYVILDYVTPGYVWLHLFSSSSRSVRR